MYHLWYDKPSYDDPWFETWLVLNDADLADPSEVDMKPLRIIVWLANLNQWLTEKWCNYYGSYQQKLWLLYNIEESQPMISEMMNQRS